MVSCKCWSIIKKTRVKLRMKNRQLSLQEITNIVGKERESYRKNLIKDFKERCLSKKNDSETQVTIFKNLTKIIYDSLPKDQETAKHLIKQICFTNSPDLEIKINQIAKIAIEAGLLDSLSTKRMQEFIAIIEGENNLRRFLSKPKDFVKNKSLHEQYILHSICHNDLIKNNFPTQAFSFELNLISAMQSLALSTFASRD